MLNKYKELLQKYEELEAKFNKLKAEQIKFSQLEIDFIRDCTVNHQKNLHRICKEIQEIARYNTVTTTYDFSPQRLNLSFTTEVKCGKQTYATLSRNTTFGPEPFEIHNSKITLVYKGKYYSGEEIEELHKFLLQLVRKGD